MARLGGQERGESQLRLAHLDGAAGNVGNVVQKKDHHANGLVLKVLRQYHKQQRDDVVEVHLGLQAGCGSPGGGEVSAASQLCPFCLPAKKP